MNLIKRIKNKFKKEPRSYISVEQLNYEVEKLSYPWKQELSDNIIRQNAFKEAMEMYEHYQERQIKKDTWDKQYPDSSFNPYSGIGLFFPKPRTGLITIYPNQVSEFSEQGSYRRLVDKLFKELIK